MTAVKGLCAPISLVVLISAVSCVRYSTERILDGIYREPSGIEALTVNGRQIEFRIHIAKGAQTGVLSRAYRYDLRPGGQISIGGSSNDWFYVDGILGRAWFWDGTNIVRKKIKTDGGGYTIENDEVTVFAPDPAGAK